MNLADVTPERVQELAVDEAHFEEIRRQLRVKARESLWYFAYHCCGYRDIDNKLHRLMCKTWQQRYYDTHTMWLIPRSHLKTSLWTVAGTLHMLVNNPDLRVLVVSARWDNAVDIISEIRSVIETNDMFRLLFPEFCPDKAEKSIQKRMRQTTARLDLPCSKWVGRKEGSVMCTSTGASMVGKHYDVMVFDDAVNDENTATKELRNKNWNWFQNMLQIRDNLTSPVKVVGTRWHYDDWYGRIIRNEERIRKEQEEEGAEVKPLYKLFRLSCYTKDESGNQVAIWPERFNKPALDDLKRELSAYIFSCQYLNDPVPEEDATFRRENIRRAPSITIPENAYHFIAVDLADEESTSGDYCVATVAAFDDSGAMYARDMVRSRDIQVLGFAEHIWRLVQKYRPLRVGVETTAFQRVIYRHYKHEAMKNGWNIPWVEIKRGKQSKFQRILGLQPRVERGDFYVVDGFPQYEALEEEMVQFPKGVHDDILDTLADLQEMAFMPEPEKSGEPRSNEITLEHVFDWIDPIEASESNSNPDLSWGSV